MSELMSRPLRWVLLENTPWRHAIRLPGHHMARWLADRGHTVAYVAPPVSPWHFLSPSHRHMARTRWRMDGALGTWRNERLFTATPRTWMPINRQWPFDSALCWNAIESATRPRFSEVLREAGFERPDVVVMHNMLLPHLPALLSPRLFVFRLEDDIAGFPAMPRIVVRRSPRLMAEADLVTHSAIQSDLRARSAGARNLMFFPNGVDTGRFARPEEMPSRPTDLPDGPVAIFVGALSSWFDRELLSETARRLPHWNFVLVGPADAGFRRFRENPNVHLLGPKLQENVPRYLWHSDVGIIPFKRQPVVECFCPLNLFEYMAAGLPTVSRRWTEMTMLCSPARLVDTADQFAAALEDAREKAAAEREGNVAWARQYDWDNLFERFVARVQGMLV
jgi:glycosyltransferase involved in cell wall biosynthesis